MDSRNVRALSALDNIGRLYEKRYRKPTRSAIDWSGKKEFIVFFFFLISQRLFLPYGPVGRASYKGPPKGV